MPHLLFVLSHQAAICSLRLLVVMGDTEKHSWIFPPILDTALLLRIYLFLDSHKEGEQFRYLTYAIREQRLKSYSKFSLKHLLSISHQDMQTPVLPEKRTQFHICQCCKCVRGGPFCSWAYIMERDALDTATPLGQCTDQMSSGPPFWCRS